MAASQPRPPSHPLTLNPSPIPSAVATALSEGEARRKHVVMVEIMGQQARAGGCHLLQGHAHDEGEGGGGMGGGGVGTGGRGRACGFAGWRFALYPAPLPPVLTGHARPAHQPTATATPPQWRIVKHPLTSVRPFQFVSVVLAEQMELDPEDQAGVAGEAPPAGCRGRPVCAY